jgi:hypothetical protein
LEHVIEIPIKIFEIREGIIEKNDNRVNEVNDRIFKKILKDFENMQLEGRHSDFRCRFKLTGLQEKLFKSIKDIYGISLTQLYIRAVIDIAKEDHCI